MNRVSVKTATMEGAGTLSFRGFQGEVGYAIRGDRLPKRAGMPGLRGSLETSPETARDLFHAGEGRLTLENGAKTRIVMLGHSEGSGVAYFETVT
jgi:hypothetical protein